MASSLDFVMSVCDVLNDLGDISYKKMFGEYGVYYKEKMVALICDNQLFVKNTETTQALLPDAPHLAPYSGAKPHLLIESFDDHSTLSTLVCRLYQELPPPKPKKKKN